MDNQEAQNLIISKIKDLISRKNLEPGDKLPSERVLSEKFKVSRRNVREAIKKLEFYELVKSIPQTGTFIANIGQIALDGIIEDILGLKEHDFESLVETRMLLELKTARLAAERRTNEDLARIEEKLNNYKEKALKGEDAIQEDLLFHLAIAKACNNSTINAIMLQITPKLISVFEYNRIINKQRNLLKSKGNGENSRTMNKGVDVMEVKRHIAIYEAIRDQDAQAATKSMEKHFEGVLKILKR